MKSDSLFRFVVIRSPYEKRFVGVGIRIWKLYIELGRVLPLESAPLTAEELDMLKEIQDEE